MMNDDYCMIKVKDEGDGIDYFLEEDRFSDHGRGIKLVYSLSDRLIIRDNIITAFVMINPNKKFYI